MTLAANGGLPEGRDPDERAAALVARMTLDEKIALVHARFGVPVRGRAAPFGSLGSAGFTPGIPRLGVPPLQETDAGLGVANPTNAPFNATAMPSGLAMAATFDPSLAEAVGKAVGGEARAMGFSLLLGGGANLIREPRGGRNFEYASEDPLLTGTIVGAEIRGTQRNGLVATLKHFALNSQENGRVLYDAHLAETSARETDLLAFEIALEAGRPGAVMASYNRVEGQYTSDSRHLISDVLKGDWGFRGWVLSDWGATHATVEAANAGLDQESGEEDDAEVYFGARLKTAVTDGRVPLARIDDMAQRILWSRIVAGQLDTPTPVNPQKQLDRPTLMRDAEIAQSVAEQAIVLLKNEQGFLPLQSPHRVLLIGGHADIGVVSGGGSSQVVPVGAIRMEGEPPGLFYGKPRLYDPSSPLQALKQELPATAFDFDDGSDVTRAARLAKAADIVIIFAEQWSNESRDSPDLKLPGAQDTLIAAVAAANPHSAVVLETGHAVTMPWLAKVPAVMEAWYPGERGGLAIARALTGRIDPAGRLPISFPGSEAQLPRPVLPKRQDTTSNPDEPIKGGPFVIDYNVEGADVGYKWDLRRGQMPLFPFGYGLSYTRFEIAHESASATDQSVRIDFDVSNVGARAGIATPQVYLDGLAFTRRLVAWQRIALTPGETRHVSLVADPRLLARYDAAAHSWHVAEGDYGLAVRAHALGKAPVLHVHLRDRSWPARHG